MGRRSIACSCAIPSGAPDPHAPHHAHKTLFYGDNLHILREFVADETVDLVYLDPPLNSNATCNVLFKACTGEGSQTQIEAFEDTWHWNEAAERAFDEVISSGNSDAAKMLLAVRSFLKDKMILTLADPTVTMRRWAGAGLYESPLHGKFPKLQILTVEELFEGKRPHMPRIDPSVFRKAKREASESQGELGV
jgi:hypothetical protein